MNKETLSALMDGELESHQQNAALSRLKEDPELQATFERYHLISDVLQRKSWHKCNCFNLGLTFRVQAAIASPTWGAGFDMPIVMNITQNRIPSSYKKCK